MAQSIPIPATGNSLAGQRIGRRLLAVLRSEWLQLVAVLALALAMNAWRLGGNGWGNTYYAAAARSMSGSWSNFFFGAFDPGGFITVDKPPVFLWVGAASVRLFGFSSWSLLLPSAVAGAATVALTWFIVRKYFGAAAATVSGAVLALTPISVAVNRLNLPEPFLILALVGAGAATLRSLESRRWWLWLALAGALVGVAFNIKMLAGWIPGPALALAIVAGTRWTGWLDTAKQLGMRLAVLAAATFAVSVSWMLIVDAWPESQRPYIGGSTDNTVQNLVVDYNGVGRVEGNEGPGAPQGNRNGQAARPGGAFLGGGNFAPQGNRGPAQAGPANGPGGIIAGAPGLWRMFDAANSGQIAWLLPFALMGSVLCFWEWRRDRVKRSAVVLWLGWVLLFGLVFSYAKGIYHSYYTSAMAPGIAALVGMTVAATFALLKRHWLWIAPFAATVLVTLLVQRKIQGRFPGFHSDLRQVTFAMVIIGAVALVAALALHRPARTLPGLIAVVAGLLVLPAGWSYSEATNVSLNTTLPQAGPREGAAGRSFGSESFDGGTDSLAAWLAKNRPGGARWDLVVTSAMNASTLIAKYNLSVMAIGGFSGRDPTISVAQFADYVEAGDVRYVMEGGGLGGAGQARGTFGPGNIAPGGVNPPPTGFQGQPQAQDGRNRAPGVAGPGNAVTNQSPAGGTISPGAPVNPVGSGLSTTLGATPVMNAVRNACAAVPASDLPAGYQQGSIYDCGAKAEALRKLGSP